MELTSTEIMEIAFNIFYLITIYVIVFFMFINRDRVADQQRKVANWFLLAFFLLALGDTGHVGFRVLAYAMGGLEENALLVGMGSLSTAITIGFFYMIFLEVWRIQFEQSRETLYYTLIGFGVLRLLIFVFPQNDWGSVVPPFGWSLLRNIPLMIQGVGVALLFLQYGRAQNDRFFVNLSLWTFVSYAFYLPVILFVRLEPLLGMLMIPKTIAYLVMAYLVYRRYFDEKTVNPRKEKAVAIPALS